MDEVGGGRPPYDPRVLGWLLATQNVLQALPTGRRQGEFLARALSEIPGVARGGICLSGSELDACEAPCRALETGFAGEPAEGCNADGIVKFPLETNQGHYGQFVLDIVDPALFAPYEPFLANYAGSLALLLENRNQQTQLEQTLDRLGESERRYRQLFTEMAAGHAVHEIILDGNGTPCDYRFLEVNPAFETLTGLRAEDVVGRRAGDVLPGLEPYWVERYGRVALTGEPFQFEDYNQDLGRHYSVVAYRPQPGQFAVVFGDITERMRLEGRLQEASEELAALNTELQSQNEELAAQGEEVEAQNEELRMAQEETADLLEQQRALLHRLQVALLDIPQQLSGVRFGHLYRSATKEAQIGGDFYDVFEAKNGRIGLLIGDVSGHGVEAARVATLVKDTVHAFSHQFRRPHLVLRETNRLLVEKGVAGFTTAFLGFLDPKDGVLVYSSAGHPPPLLKIDSTVTLIESMNVPLGVFAEARYRDSEADIPEAGLLLFYTDGITEARRGAAFFGEAGLTAALLGHEGQAVEALPSLLLEEALLFSGGQLEDDAALLAVHFLGKTCGGNTG